MSKELRNLVKKIQFLKNWTAEEVAKSVGYSRVHLQREMKKQETSELEAMLKEKHHALLQNASNVLLEKKGKQTVTNDLSALIQGQAELIESQLVLAANHAELINLLKANSDKTKPPSPLKSGNHH